MLYDILCEQLNPRSGKIQPYDDKRGCIFFDIKWKGDFHFIVSGWYHHNGWYCVQRKSEVISEEYYFRKIDNTLFKSMQKMIDEIENGKYKGKKTLSEKIREVVEDRNLTSYMNNTKWDELIKVIKEQIPKIPIRYKTLFENDNPTIYWTIQGDELFEPMNKAAIEWFHILCEIKEIKYNGRLVEPTVIIEDKKEEVYSILNRYSISYEYDEKENICIIYGYK